MTGVANESLKQTGKQPVVNDVLNKCVRNGTSKSATVLRTGTGIGSSADDSGRRDTAAATSSDDSGVNSEGYTMCNNNSDCK